MSIIITADPADPHEHPHGDDPQQVGWGHLLGLPLLSHVPLPTQTKILAQTGLLLFSFLLLDTKKFLHPQGERGLVLRPGLAKRPGGRGGKRPCRVL